MAATIVVLLVRAAMPIHLALPAHLNQRLLLMLVRPTVGRISLMLQHHAQKLVLVAPALNALILALSIPALPTHHVMTRIPISAEQLGATHHQTAYFPVRVVTTVNVPMEHSASLTHHATRMKRSCVEQVSRMPLPANARVLREVAASVPLVNHASPTQLVKHQLQHKSLQLHQIHTFVVHHFLMHQLNAQNHAQRCLIQNAPTASNATQTLHVTEKLIVVQHTRRHPQHAPFHALQEAVMTVPLEPNAFP